MDYILGRNPNVKSYVAGYGERPMQTRTIGSGRTRRTRVPAPAPGALAGGPNSGWTIPFARACLRGGLRAAEVLRRPHRVVLHERGRHQLERAAGLDRGFLDGARALHSRGGGR